MSLSNEELLPCPFCGGTKLKEIAVSNTGGNVRHIWCMTCQASGPWFNGGHPANRWNESAPLSQRGEADEAWTRVRIVMWRIDELRSSAEPSPPVSAVPDSLESDIQWLWQHCGDVLTQSGIVQSEEAMNRFGRVGMEISRLTAAPQPPSAPPGAGKVLELSVPRHKIEGIKTEAMAHLKRSESPNCSAIVRICQRLLGERDYFEPYTEASSRSSCRGGG